MATVSIVIPAYNAERTIARTVTAALSQQGLSEAHEVIVVDDGSSDRTADIAESLGALCIRQANAGPAAARNAGWRNSRGKFVLFTDSDCVPDPYWAARLVEAFEDPDVGAAGGSYLMANEGGVVAAGVHWEIVARHRRFGRYVRALGSYNMAVRREVMEAVDGFDETYPSASGEDNDLSYRIAREGYKLAWVHQALVGHFHTNKLGKYLREQYRHGYYRAKLYGSHVNKISGDDYTMPKDILELPLVCVFVLSIALCWLTWGRWIAAGLLATLVVIQVPMAVRMICAGGTLSTLLHTGVMILRAFARSAGFVLGVISALVSLWGREPKGAGT